MATGYQGNDPFQFVDFNEISPSFLNGTTGTFNTQNNGSIGYTVEENIAEIPGLPDGSWFNLSPGNTIRADGASYLEVEFDAPVSGIQVLTSGSDPNEEYSVIIDSVTVNLKDLVDAGLATFETARRSDYLDHPNATVAARGLLPGTHELKDNGSIGGDSTSGANNYSLGVVTFLEEIETIRVTGSGGASGSGFYDWVSIGIRSANLAGAVCFSSGTLISTPNGDVAVEELAVGDMVTTLERGSQPIRWINSRTIDAKQMRANPKLRPIQICAGALGNNLPKRDLIVSPQHRMLVSSKLVNRMFGSEMVLIAAKRLVGIEGIDYADVDKVTYVHFLCDQHEVVFCENAPSESLYVGKEALKTIPERLREEIFSIFPDLANTDSDYKPKPAIALARGKKARNFADRVERNNRKLLESIF